ncbi:MAG: phosphoribosylformylglycinamidine synthase subunit PurQ, partial [Candidatus Hydrogenedentes bacterium]|nr:phosphoribosylformylglycinamidine synthase subunit PurQ [Candidatus Hydrogenedentota bacterium]
MNVRAIVLTGYGINCDNETQSALQRAGAEADRVHLNDIIADVSRLDAYHIFAVPGGFSFGDDV